MTALDTRLVPRAKAIIDKYGKTISYVQNGAETYDASQGSGTSTPATPATRTAKAIFAKGNNALDGNQVEGRARLLYIAAAALAGLAPKAGDSITVDGLTFTAVIDPEVIYSGEEPCLYAVMMKL